MVGRYAGEGNGEVLFFPFGKGPLLVGGGMKINMKRQK